MRLSSRGETAAFGCGEFATFVAGEFATLYDARVAVNLLASHCGELRPKAAEDPGAVAFQATGNLAGVSSAGELDQDIAKQLLSRR